MKHLATLVLIALTPVAARATMANEPPPSNWRKGSYGASAYTEYFTTKANYGNSRGEFTRLIGDSTFSSLETRIRGRYAVSPRYSFFAGAGMGYSRAIDTLAEKTNSSLTDIHAGLNFMAYRGWLRIVPEIMGGFPLDETNRTQTEPLTSDGVAYGRAGIHLFKPFKYLRVQTYTGLHIPADGLAKRFLYELAVEVPFGESIGIGASFNGYETAFPDEIPQIERLKTTTRADSGSQRFFAWEPALMEARAWVGFRPDPGFTVRAGFGKTIDGVRSAEGASFLLSFVFNRGEKSATPPKGPKLMPDPHEREEAVDKFEADTEQPDQQYFEDEAPPVPTAKEALDKAEKMLEKKK